MNTEITKNNLSLIVQKLGSNKLNAEWETYKDFITDGITLIDELLKVIYDKNINIAQNFGFHAQKEMKYRKTQKENLELISTVSDLIEIKNELELKISKLLENAKM